MKSKKIYICELDRFGYTLTAAGETEEQAKNSVIKEYVRAYKNWNDGANPRKDEYRDGVSYYDEMLEDINTTEMTIGKVEWR